MSPRNIVSTCLAFLLVVCLTLPVVADDRGKNEQTLENAANVLKSMVSDKQIPADVLSKADCVIILPGVKKLAIGIGGSGGRGAMSCRQGKDFTGYWSPPAMYSIGGASAGLQLGASSSDFVLLVMSPGAVDKVLSGKVKVGSDMTAAAGPLGATSATPVGGAEVLTYARAKGAFAGVSLDGATLEQDNAANSTLYTGAYHSPQDIVLKAAVTATTAGQGLIAELEKFPKHAQ